MRFEKIFKDDYTVYKNSFSNLTDLHDYLANKPKVNKQIFRTLASVHGAREFAGEPLKNAIEYCISGCGDNINNFLQANEKLNKVKKDISDNRKAVRGLFGGLPIPSLVAADIPACMLRYEREASSSVKNIYLNLSYSYSTNTNQIVNRGLIALFLIQAYEDKGEIVNFNTFELSKLGHEIVDTEINLKRPGERNVDIGKCYYPLVRKEFLRRILFRVLESTPVENDWAEGYGSPLTAREIRNFLELSDNDIIIPSPDDLEIYGYNIYEDAENALTNLGLTEDFDIDKIKKLSMYNKR